MTPCPQGHLCWRGEEIDDPDKGCKNLQDSWRFSSMRRLWIMWRWLKLPLAQGIGVQIFTMYTEIYAHIKTISKRMFFNSANGIL